MTTLREQAIELARTGLEGDGPLLPFVLVTIPNQPAQCWTIVTERSDRALHSGRRIVGERAANASEYAIAVDTYVRVDGRRYDAVLVEVGFRGNETAYVTAHRYERARGKATLVDRGLDFEKRPTALVPWDPFSLSWGSITPDFYNERLNHAVHVVSHVLSSSDQVTRTSRFLRARGRCFAQILPAGLKQSAFVEDRHRPLAPAVREELARGLAGAMEIQYLSELNKEA